MGEYSNSAVLVALGDPRQLEITREHLDELAFLAETAGIITEKRFVQHLGQPDGRTFVGKGKLAEIKEYVHTNGIRNVIFDDDLSPSQLRNLERELNPKELEDVQVKIYDRSLLILDIVLSID